MMIAAVWTLARNLNCIGIWYDTPILIAQPIQANQIINHFVSTSIEREIRKVSSMIFTAFKLNIVLDGR